jgi:Flp pilus assembly protein TadG
MGAFPKRVVPSAESRLLDRRGSVAVETAIVLLFVLMFILGTIDMGRLIWSNATLSWAVQAAARCGALMVCATTAQIQQNAVSQAWTLNVSTSNFSVATQSCGLSVSASYTFTFLTPGLANITLNPAACFIQYNSSTS